MEEEDSFFDKYAPHVIGGLNKENFEKIVNFLISTNCNCIEDIVTDYLDLFLFDYSDFKNKYDILNKKYDNCYWNKVSYNMDLLEEFYSI